jgi:hypothetical protein
MANRDVLFSSFKLGLIIYIVNSYSACHSLLVIEQIISLLKNQQK